MSDFEIEPHMYTETYELMRRVIERITGRDPSVEEKLAAVAELEFLQTRFVN
jgi:hypothetical protein